MAFRYTFIGAIVGALLWLLALPALAGGWVNKDADEVAILGYDPVAYFTMGQPILGSPEFEYEWLDAIWRFVSSEHRDLFVGDPDKYAPKYGGYCAGSLALGFMARVEPQAWVIIDGQLYLNSSKKLLAEFTDDADNQIAAADANWERLTPGQ